MRIFIVGGGPSLSGFDFNQLRNIDTIAVNKCILDIPWSKYFVTIDHSFFTKTNGIRRKLKNLNARKYFVANFATGQLKHNNGKIYCTKTKKHYDLKCVDYTIISNRIDGIGISWDDFRNGNNSGYCALQLAVLLGAKEIYLLGIDLEVGQNTHYHGGYGEGVRTVRRKLDSYYPVFEGAINKIKSLDIQIKSCSKSSRLNHLIEYVPPELVL